MSNPNSPVPPPPPGAPYQPPEGLEFKDWLITLLILAIPCFGTVMLFIWAFSKDRPVRANFCKAYLVFFVIVAVLGSVFATIFSAAIVSAFM